MNIHGGKPSNCRDSNASGWTWTFSNTSIFKLHLSLRLFSGNFYQKRKLLQKCLVFEMYHSSVDAEVVLFFYSRWRLNEYIMLSNPEGGRRKRETYNLFKTEASCVILTQRQPVAQICEIWEFKASNQCIVSVQNMADLYKPWSACTAFQTSMNILVLFAFLVMRSKYLQVSLSSSSALSLQKLFWKVQ